jgi:hypothetical protein
MEKNLRGEARPPPLCFRFGVASLRAGSGVLTPWYGRWGPARLSSRAGKSSPAFVVEMHVYKAVKRMSVSGDARIACLERHIWAG